MPITIPALDNGAVTTVTLVDDELYENDEEVRLTLTSAQFADLGTQIEHVLTIVDDDPMPVISFDVATSIGSEDVPRVFIYARMDRFSAIDTQVRLNINPAGTTAQNGNGGNPGDDFDIDEGVLTIPAGEREAEIEITIFNNDADTEENETVALVLSDPVNAELGTPSTHTLTIRENAQAAEVGFQNAGVSRDENFGVAIARLVLSEATNANVTISFGVGGTASAGFDYSGIRPPGDDGCRRPVCRYPGADH
jgi:hypothetical protein